MIKLEPATLNDIGDYKELKNKYVDDKNTFLKRCNREEKVLPLGTTDICEDLTDDAMSTYFITVDNVKVGYTQFYGNVENGVKSLYISAIYLDLSLCERAMPAHQVMRLKCVIIDTIVHHFVGDNKEGLKNIVIQPYEFMISEDLKRTLGYSAFTELMRFPIDEFFKKL